MQSKTIFFFLLWGWVAQTWAGNLDGQRQKVYSIVKQKQTKNWYAHQSDLWKAYLDEHESSREGWLNYYTAQRMLKILRGGVTQKDLDKLVAKMERKIPNTFEYHYITCWNTGISSSDDYIQHLSKAHELEPDRPEVYDEFLTYYETHRERDQLTKIAQKWYASNDISPGLYAWNYNMLQTVENDGILITVGDNDTYPALVLQYAKGIRTDVIVMNNSLLGLDDYRTMYFKELGIPAMKKKMKDFPSWTAYQQGIIEHLKQYSGRPIYFAVSAHSSLYEPFKEEVYNVGMAYKWSKKQFDNIAVTKRNFEKKYLVDYLKIEFENDLSQTVVDHMNANYLISLLTLYNHYLESEDEKAAELEVLIQRIAEKNHMEEKVADVLNQPINETVSRVITDPRILEKGLVQIKDSLYAGKTEVTNKMYNLFLTDLLKQKRFDDLAIAKSEEVEWRAFLSEKDQDKPNDKLFENGAPDDDAFPVLNISHEAAQLYCKWLTRVYNETTHRRKKFKQVVFRLPSEKEWEYLALGGKEKSAYAWDGPYVRNARGCFIANLDMSEVVQTEQSKNDLKECASCNSSDIDGGVFPVVTGSYLPNNYGLFNMTGNVAEMVQEPGIAKGGSWNTLAGRATILNKEHIEKPSPMVGFRVIMEIK